MFLAALNDDGGSDATVLCTVECCCLERLFWNPSSDSSIFVAAWVEMRLRHNSSRFSVSMALHIRTPIYQQRDVMSRMVESRIWSVLLYVPQ